MLDTIYLEEGEVTGVELLDMDCFGVRVNGPKVGDVTSLQLEQLEYLGKGQVAVTFVMDAKAQVDYCESYVDYLDHKRDESIEVKSMNGVGICDLKEIRPVRIAGKLIINIGQEGDVDVMRAAITAGDFSDEGLEFEVATATLLST